MQATVIKRLGILNNYLMAKLVSGTLETSKQVALYALIKTDQLYFESMLDGMLNKDTANWLLDILKTEKIRTVMPPAFAGVMSQHGIKFQRG